MAEKQQLRIIEATPPLAGRFVWPLAQLRRELVTIVVVLLAFLVLDLRFGGETRTLIRAGAIGIALALGLAVLTTAFLPRRSK